MIRRVKGDWFWIRRDNILSFIDGWLFDYRLSLDYFFACIWVMFGRLTRSFILPALYPISTTLTTHLYNNRIQ